MITNIIDYNHVNDVVGNELEFGSSSHIASSYVKNPQPVVTLSL